MNAFLMRNDGTVDKVDIVTSAVRTNTWFRKDPYVRFSRGKDDPDNEPKGVGFIVLLDSEWMKKVVHPLRSFTTTFTPLNKSWINLYFLFVSAKDTLGF